MGMRFDRSLPRQCSLGKVDDVSGVVKRDNVPYRNVFLSALYDSTKPRTCVAAAQRSNPADPGKPPQQVRARDPSDSARECRPSAFRFQRGRVVVRSRSLQPSDQFKSILVGVFGIRG